MLTQSCKISSAVPRDTKRNGTTDLGRESAPQSLADFSIDESLDPRLAERVRPVVPAPVLPVGVGGKAVDVEVLSDPDSACEESGDQIRSSASG